ncbi:MAG: hypothetical protein V4568_01015 [Pseudomonadota bacterium]
MPHSTIRYARNESIVEKIFIIGLLLAVWLLSHPYQGIWHDGTLYAGQAYQRLQPEAFRRDLFFAFGSQDAFTIFTPVYAWLINVVGLSAATIGSLLALQILWFVSYWVLCRQFLEGRWLYLALLLAFGMSPRYYGGLQIFSYAEIFLTARLAAEAFSLAALAVYFSGYRNVGLFIGLAATGIHPLVGGWVAALLFLIRLGWRVSAICGVLAVIAVSIFKPAIITAVLTPMDAEWRTLVVENSAQVFIEHWGFEYWSRSGMALSLVLAAAAITTDKARLLWLSLTGIAAAALTLCWLGTTSFHSVLLTQLQLWRVLWLVSALQWIAVIQLIRTLWPTKTGRVWLTWLLIAWILRDNFGGFLALSIAIAFCFFSKRKLPPLSDSFEKYITIGTRASLAVAVALWLPNVAMDAWLEGGNYTRNKTLATQIFTGITLTEAILLIVLPAWWLISKAPSARRSIALGILAVGLLTVSVLRWDQRYPLQSFIEHIVEDTKNPPFNGLIKAGDIVFWPGGLQLTWFALRTANYASNIQVSGIVFNRLTALEAKRRLYRAAAMALPLDKLAAAGPLQVKVEIAKLGMDRNLRSQETFFATRSGLIHLCHDPILDFVVLGTPFSEMHSAEFPTSINKLRFWLYDCKRLRQEYPDPMPELN